MRERKWCKIFLIGKKLRLGNTCPRIQAMGHQMGRISRKVGSRMRTIIIRRTTDDINSTWPRKGGYNYYLNNSEWEPSRISEIVCSLVLIQIIRKSFWMWHSMQPMNSPDKWWGLCDGSTVPVS